MKGKWKKISSKYVYQNDWIKVREDQVIRPDGKLGIYGVVENVKSLCIIPVAADGKIWFVKTYRYIFDDTRWELVDGDIEEKEDPEEAAKRELREELGMEAGEWQRLGIFRPSDGSMDQVTEVFLASDLRSVVTGNQEFDIVDRQTFSLQEIDQMIRNGEIVCGYVMNALYLYQLSKL